MGAGFHVRVASAVPVSLKPTSGRRLCPQALSGSYKGSSGRYYSPDHEKILM